VSSLRQPESPFSVSDAPSSTAGDSDGRRTPGLFSPGNGFAAANGDLENGAWDRDLRFLPDDVREAVPGTPREAEAGQPIKRSMRLIGNAVPRYRWYGFCDDLHLGSNSMCSLFVFCIGA